MTAPATYETVVPKKCFRTDDLFNRARGLHLYVVACICEREGLTMPTPGDDVVSGFCDESGAPCMEGDATHFGWTLTSRTPAELWSRNSEGDS